MTYNEIIRKLLISQIAIDHPEKPRGNIILGVKLPQGNIIPFRNSKIDISDEIAFKVLPMAEYVQDYDCYKLKLIDITPNGVPIIEIERDEKGNLIAI